MIHIADSQCHQVENGKFFGQTAQYSIRKMCTFTLSKDKKTRLLSEKFWKFGNEMTVASEF